MNVIKGTVSVIKGTVSSVIKGTVNVIVSDLPCKDSQTVIVKDLSVCL